jgi:hypothetical protein
MLRLLLEYACRWSVSTLGGAASAWFRLHWLAKEMEAEGPDLYSGPTLAALFRCVAATATSKAANLKEPVGRATHNGSTAETQVRNGLLWVSDNLGVELPSLRAKFTKKMKWGARQPPSPFRPISIRALHLIESAATGLTPDTPEIVQQYCAMFEPLALGCLRQEQANCSQILSFKEPTAGCYIGITDREKSNQPHKMLARFFWMPVEGVISNAYGLRFADTTSNTQLAGICVRENDSPTGDPFKATKLLNRPMKPERMLVALRRILHVVCGIPHEDLHHYGVSSLRKFLPEIAKALDLPPDRCRPAPSSPPPELLLHILPSTSSLPLQSCCSPPIHSNTSTTLPSPLPSCCSTSSPPLRVAAPHPAPHPSCCSTSSLPLHTPPELLFSSSRAAALLLFNPPPLPP